MSSPTDWAEWLRQYVVDQNKTGVSPKRMIQIDMDDPQERWDDLYKQIEKMGAESFIGKPVLKPKPLFDNEGGG